MTSVTWARSASVVAGVMRMRLLPFVLVVAVAKGGRYGVLAWVVMG